MKALVVGAGIGGLASAIALQRAGVEVEVFERAPEPGEVGAGISLWPNALHALERLGMGHVVREAAVPDMGGAIHAADGSVLAAADPDALQRELGRRSVVLHRADLLGGLLEGVGPARVRFGAAAVSVRERGGVVELALAGGRTASGDLVVAADGIRSAIRDQLFPEVRPRYAGYTAWRGIARFAAPAGATYWGESWGRGARFGLLPIGRDRVYWFAVHNAPEGALDDPAGRRDALLGWFAGWHHPIPELIAATEAGHVLRNDIYDLPPLARWAVGRVTLLGDAAHATTPNLGQGGCQALEDAVALGDALAGTADVAEGLRVFEARRIDRANMIINVSRRVGIVAQWQHPVACWLRDTLVKLTPHRVRMSQLRPIAGYEV